ncbi:hypothetical protein LCGC14_0415820 [marine sediment metagenome]|uniref:AP2/ERF domain-containing protein n=1 Tax=marine sediment metagenome TaxID=412755 RepID=A0A0F9VEE8_9ZZZZ
MNCGLDKCPVESVTLIKLTKGKYTIIDTADCWLFKYKWNVTGVGRYLYAARGNLQDNGKRRLELMHRKIMDAPKGMVVDHINHNTLDNRRANMRVCTNSQNSCNSLPVEGSSKYKGVHWSEYQERWVAQIKLDYKYHNVGVFKDEIKAAEAYDEKAIELFGEFAYLNFSREKCNVR